MPKYNLFVCKSCHRSSQERPENPPFDGEFLLEKLNNLCKEKDSLNELEIKPVECLWACNHGCVVAASHPDKPTYIFVNLTPEESAASLLEFMQLYIKSRKGNIAWKQLPEVLQAAIFAQIPPGEK
ncbi:hypothetical protein NIES2107_62750 [Nostoc carneum NIES-2107]|nr:hypothetical protein NIES2107_62750 [Nostoc carneum NIES-2107]